MTESLASAAVRYASLNWRIFPVASRGKLPLFPKCPVNAELHLQGQPAECRGSCGHVGHGVYDATCDTAIVSAWWERAENANIGLACGHGLFVLDVDVKAPEGGISGGEALERLASEGKHLPPTMTSETGSGGRQYFFKSPVGRSLGNRVKMRVGGAKSGLDVRTEGGFVVLPPSIHPNGKPYTWLDAQAPAEAPPWLLDLIDPPKPTVVSTPRDSYGSASDSRERKYVTRALDNAAATISAAPEKSRHDTLNASAFALGQLIGGGAPLSEGEATDALTTSALAVFPASRHAEVRRTIRDGLTSGKANPKAWPPEGWNSERNSERSSSRPPPPSDADAPMVEELDAYGAVALVQPALWEAPVPFGEASDPPAFPTSHLPDVLRAFVSGLAEQTQTPVDMAALFTLSVCGVTIAGRVRGYPWWAEPVPVWAVVAMEPGSRKSAVASEVVRPLQAAEAEGAIKYAPIIREAKVRKKVLEERAGKAESAASRGAEHELDGLIREAANAAEQRDSVTIPVAPRYVADDVTPEKLVGLLQEHGGRFAVISAEGGPFDMMAGRYSDGLPNVDVYLKGHAGDPISVDRMGRPHEHIESPALSVALAIQPDILRGLAEKPGFRGRGLLGRFLYAIPRSRVGRRVSHAPPMPESYRREYHDVVRRLLSLDIPTPAPSVRFDAAAKSALRTFMDELEPRLGESGDLAHMADWAGKLAGAVVRIAVVTHMVEHASEDAPWALEVDVLTVNSAIAIGLYALEHARTAFAMMGADPKHTAAKHLLGWIRGNTPQGHYVERDAFNATKGRFRKMEAFREAQTVLVDHGYLKVAPRVKEAGKAGRPPSKTFLVNPLWVRE